MPKPPKAAKPERQGVVTILETPSPPPEQADDGAVSGGSTCSRGGLGASRIWITPCFSSFAAFGGLGVEGEAIARFSTAVVASVTGCSGAKT